MIKIVMTSPIIGELDILENTNIPLTFSVGDIRDVTKRKGGFSKTVKLANTNNNNILLNNYFDVNIADGTFNIKKLAKCQVFENDVLIVDNASLQLINVNKVQNNSYSEHQIIYEVLVKDVVSDFFTTINNKELTDLFWGDLDHIFSAEEIILSQAQELGYFYFYPHKPNTNFNYQYDLRDFAPAIRVKEYIDRIFNQAGYSYTFPDANADDIRFNKLIIPYNGDKMKQNAESINDLRAIYRKSDYNVLTKTIVDNTAEIQDYGSNFTPVTGIYENDFYVGGSSTLQYNLLIQYTVDINNNDIVDATLTDTNTLPNAAANYVPRADLIKNSNPEAGTNINFAADQTTFQVSAGTTLNAGDTINISNGVRTANLNMFLSNLNPFINQIQARIGVDQLLANQFLVQNNPANQVFWRDSSNNLVDVRPVINIIDILVTVTANLEEIGFNSPIRINSVVPQKVKQSEFLKSIFSMFNLFLLPDKTNPNNFIIKRRNDFYDSGKEVDWTEKLAVDREQIIEFLPDLSSKKTILKYKDDDNDEALKQYKIQTKESYGQYEYIFETDYVKEIKNQEVIFSPLVSVPDDNNILLPLITTPPKNNIKIALVEAGTFLPAPTIVIRNYFGDSASGEPAIFVPHVSHFTFIEYDNNTGYFSTPEFDLNFGINDFYINTPLLNVTNNNLFNLHWRRTFDQINNGKMFTAYFNLNESDINQLELNEKIWVKDSWWNINQIIDYSAGEANLTKVELISIDNGLVLASSGDTDNGEVNPSPSFPNPITLPQTTTNYLRKNEELNNSTKNQINTVSPIILNGKDNFIDSEAGYSIVNGNNNNMSKKTIVFGDDNINTGYTNVVIIGTGKTATQSNTLYTDNIQIASGATINGVDPSSLALWTAGTGSNSIQQSNTGAIASGTSSVAIGASTQALGGRSFAAGSGSIALGGTSFAAGSDTQAIGGTSSAFGSSTIASGNTSFAIGNNTKAINHNEFAHGHQVGSKVGQRGDLIYVGTTTGTTPTLLSLNNGSAYMTIPSDSVYMVGIDVIGRDSSGNVSIFLITGAIKNNGGTTSLVGTPSYTQYAADAPLVTTDVTLIANDTNDTLQIEVEGVAATNITWVAHVNYTAIL